MNGGRARCVDRLKSAVSVLWRRGILILGALALSGGTTVAQPSGGSFSESPPQHLLTAPTGTSINAPARNTVFVCSGPIPILLVRPKTPWVDAATGVIDVAKRPVVEGTLLWDSQFSVTVSLLRRHFKGNGLPNHPTGVYPVEPGTAAYQYYAAVPDPFGQYANAAEIPIEPWDLDISIPRFPVIARQTSCISSLTVGVALTGAPFHLEVAVDGNFNAVDPNAALPLDPCWGHPVNAQYHYHGPSYACFDSNTTNEHSPLVGYIIDGFGIYGPRGDGGKLVTNAELDECHGHKHPVRWEGEVVNMYHYHLNAEYPYSIGCYRGRPARLPHLH
jgi:hypothetical protein